MDHVSIFLRVQSAQRGPQAGTQGTPRGGLKPAGLALSRFWVQGQHSGRAWHPRALTPFLFRVSWALSRQDLDGIHYQHSFGGAWSSEGGCWGPRLLGAAPGQAVRPTAWGHPRDERLCELVPPHSKSHESTPRATHRSCRLGAKLKCGTLFKSH